MGLFEKVSEFEEKLVTDMQKSDKGKDPKSVAIKISIIVILVAIVCGAFIMYYIPRYM